MHQRIIDKIEARKREIAEKAKADGLFVLEYATRDEIVAQVQKLVSIGGNREVIEMLLDRLDMDDAAVVRMGLWAFDPNVGKD